MIAEQEPQVNPKYGKCSSNQATKTAAQPALLLLLAIKLDLTNILHQ